MVAFELHKRLFNPEADDPMDRLERIDYALARIDADGHVLEQNLKRLTARAHKIRNGPEAMNESAWLEILEMTGKLSSQLAELVKALAVVAIHDLRFSGRLVAKSLALAPHTPRRWERLIFEPEE
ncbi:hypothetical protein MHK12_05810 [Corynebacterium kefirresidentii]|uniref:hypothetical protein n=1 Tax=Corynebacterium TaxID=1716 RepID=UPI001EF22C61|nr:hypothetical protein [Corynebacterium kefirresidentii]MCG7450110.1 hypothetical protein [Corynebacterium kefirresidentii]MCG7452273.1 hypothetical protein [Corynebacterium kefirresidentii]